LIKTFYNRVSVCTSQGKCERRKEATLFIETETNKEDTQDYEIENGLNVMLNACKIQERI